MSKELTRVMGMVTWMGLVTIGLVGCKKPAEQAKMDADKQVVEQAQSPESQPEEHTHKHGESGHGGGEHHHHFDDPEKYAERWNDPERDSWQHPEEIIAAMSVSPGATVVDVGAGTGYMVAHLSKAVGESGSVMALDVEEAMVKYIAARKDELGPATILPRKVSSDSPALKPEQVDAVMTLNTWHHISHRDYYARKVFEGLKPGGKFVVVDFELDADPGPPKEMRLDAKTIIEELQGAGFSAELVTESMPRHYMVVGTKAP